MDLVFPVFHLFHWYGFLVGSGVALTLYILEKYLVPHILSEQFFWRITGYLLVGALVGSRGWHVATDWQLYTAQPLRAFYIWEGGLSIIGALAGVVVGVGLLRAVGVLSQVQLWSFFDALALALPPGQALGRVGNYVNQELYGWPTTGWWGIYIEPVHRHPDFATAAYYHPLFLYEGVALLLFWLVVWRFGVRKFSLGSRTLFGMYVGYYGVVRFLLDFMRLDMTRVWFGLGVNQVVIGMVLVMLLGYVFLNIIRARYERY